MKTVYILQGSNEGDRLEILDLSVQEIEKRIGACTASSSVYESEPWGFEARQWFLNRVIVVKTDLEPLAILRELLAIELEFGRKRLDDGRYHSRTLDLDILFIDRQIISTPELEVPHPQLQNRRFTLLPLAEIAPTFLHPTLLKTMSALLSECPDQAEVKKV